jgi:hypothetical protein
MKTKTEITITLEMDGDEAVALEEAISQVLTLMGNVQTSGTHLDATVERMVSNGVSDRLLAFHHAIREARLEF